MDSHKTTPAYLKMKAQALQYYYDNHEYCKKRAMEYFHKNHDAILKHLKREVKCDICGVCMKLCSMSKHRKTKMHNMNVNKSIIKQPIEVI